MHLVTRSIRREVFGVSSQGDTQEREIRRREAGGRHCRGREKDFANRRQRHDALSDIPSITGVLTQKLRERTGLAE